eukprot:g747.t1
MRPLSAKQAGDLYHSARTAPYCKDKRPNLLTTYGVTANDVRCTTDGFVDKQEDVVVKSLRPAIHLTDARGTIYANTCPANLIKCWNAAGIKPKITKSGLHACLNKMLKTITADGGVYLGIRVEVKSYCSESGAKWLGGGKKRKRKRAGDTADPGSSSSSSSSNNHDDQQPASAGGAASNTPKKKVKVKTEAEKVATAAAAAASAAPLPRSAPPECSFCMDAVASYMFMPCKHMVLCGDCIDQPFPNQQCIVCDVAYDEITDQTAGGEDLTQVFGP